MSLFRSLAPISLATAALATVAVPAASAQTRTGDSDRDSGPQRLVDKAASVVVEMQRNDPGIRPLLRRAVGLYIIPEYGRGGFLIGGKGGAGVVVDRTAHGWSGPAFFNTGGLNIGLQAGASGGSIVYLLMNRRAVNVFRTNADKFSLDAHAGLAVVTYSKGRDLSTFKGDALQWSNMRGAYAGAVVGATGIGFDSGRARDYYGHPVSVSAILNGEARAPGAQSLDRALPR